MHGLEKDLVVICIIIAYASDVELQPKVVYKIWDVQLIVNEKRAADAAESHHSRESSDGDGS